MTDDSIYWRVFWLVLICIAIATLVKIVRPQYTSWWQIIKLIIVYIFYMVICMFPIWFS